MEKIKKNYILGGIFLMLSLVMTLTSCDKKWPINGDVDGHWQLMEVTYKEADTTATRHRVYMAIQLHMTELKDLGNNGYGDYVAEFDYDEDEDRVVISHVKSKSSTSDNGVLADPKALVPYGLNSAEQNVFRVIKADGKHLVLESDFAILKMRSF